MEVGQIGPRSAQDNKGRTFSDLLAPLIWLFNRFSSLKVNGQRPSGMAHEGKAKMILTT